MQLIHDDFLNEIKTSVVDSVAKLISGVEDNLNERARYLNKKEACKYVGVSNPTLNEWISQGLPIIRIGNVERLDKKDIDLFLLKNKF